MKDKKLMEYTFSANYDPISKRDTVEMMSVKIPACTKEDAWDKLTWLVGGVAAVERWRFTDENEYCGVSDMDKQIEYEYILECIEHGEDLDSNTVMKQLKSLWTAYCLHRNLDVDTAEYDNRMAEMWKLMQENESSPDWLDEYGRFYNAMSSYLV